MQSVVKVTLGLALGLCVARAEAQHGVWRPVEPAKPASAPLITLGRPVPLDEPPVAAAAHVGAPTSAPAINLGMPKPLVRAQGADLQPPVPPPPPAPSPFAVGGLGGEEAYNCGVVGPKRAGFFNRAWDGCREWFHGVPRSVEGIFQPGPGGRGGIFESDHEYDDKLISPTTNPFYFTDPRALTEVRPIFMWQRTPSSNYLFAGGDNFFMGVQGSLAITPWFSVVVHQLGWTWMEVENQMGEFANNHTGFSEFHIGPKVTFFRGESFVMAAGLIFEIPSGPRRVFQDTGDLSLAPYVSLGWNFWSGQLGSLIFLNTTGYSASVNDERTEFLYSSFNLSLDVYNLHRIYPFMEINWVHYTVNGRTRDIGFEGRDLFHFGSNGAAGHDELTLAFGSRFKLNDWIHFGLGAEFSIIGGGRHMDRFRLTTDMIFRY